MSLTLELNALVLGDDPSHVFTVEIEGTKNVSALKDAIKDKKKHAFEHVDADALNIFRVSFPAIDDPDATLKRFRPEHDPEKGVHHLSVPVKRLKGVFGDPVDQHIHVIVQPPFAGKHQSLWLMSIFIVASTHPASSPDSSFYHHDFNINCIVFGDDPSHVFTIEIEGTKNVSALKDAIKDKNKHAFEHVDAHALNLWQVSIPVANGFEENVTKVELTKDEALSPLRKISQVFADQPDGAHLHIIVLCPPPSSECKYTR